MLGWVIWWLCGCRVGSFAFGMRKIGDAFELVRTIELYCGSSACLFLWFGVWQIGAVFDLVCVALCIMVLMLPHLGFLFRLNVEFRTTVAVADGLLL